MKDEFVLCVSSVNFGSKNRSFSAHIFFPKNTQSGVRGSWKYKFNAAAVGVS